ncbi:pyruvate, water dikinase regulatory protein [Oceanobacillus sp. FSL H7-0719]|uniref:pyruvate, water dikinase regulatory protein n=1 Tax=Oceanobacillus sp. FSL H7-0719 TaxID=2954507 RepID=UPI003243B046
MSTQPNVYILSDSVGETAELVVKAGLSQFNNGEYKIHRVPYVEDKETIDEYLQIIKANNAMIGFTLVEPELRSYLNDQAEKMGIEAIDIMGPTIKSMERFFRTEPRLEPGLVHKLDEDYFKRVEAIEFAVKYDDGRDPRGISRADIILVGVSRTSKTPLSQYLANKRIKVANVPIVPEVDPPEELFEVNPEKCIGLRISPDKLNEIRKERLKALGLGNQATYATLNRINQELEYFNSIVDKIGCEVIDVSNKAVEETANLILQMFKKKQNKF